MSHSVRIAYYVTSHGYGHMNRACAVIAQLPRSVKVAVFTSRDQFSRFNESIPGRVRLVDRVFDSGAVHPPGESSLVDCAATLDKYRTVHAAGVRRLEREVNGLIEERFDVVVSDAAPLPLRAARQAGIPGILIANFTWHDIFRHFARTGSADDREMLAEMNREYHEATVYLRAEPAVPNALRVPATEVGMVARRGRGRRLELRRALGLRSDRALTYLYVGRYGQDDMDWRLLTRVRECDFVSYHTIPDQPDHWHVVSPAEWPPADLAASVDVMVAKAGYGTVTDAMRHGTPLVYPPRHGFVEHRVLAAALSRWGGGVPIQTREFKKLNLSRAIVTALRWSRVRAKLPVDGARRCARAILKACGV